MFAVSLLAEPIVSKIVHEANSFVLNKYHQLYGVESEVDRLSSNLRAIQAALEEATERSLTDSKSKQLLDWLKNLQDVALDVEDVLETFAAEAASRGKQKCHAPMTWLCFRLEAANKIKGVVRRMDVISKEKADFHFKGSDYVNQKWKPQQSISGQRLREKSCHRDTSDIIGREEEKLEVVNWLLSDQSNLEGCVPVYAIIGMGGLGKTSLAQLVYNDDRIYKEKDESCHFKAAVWANVSADATVHGILRQMAEILTEVSHDTISLSKIQERILVALDGKRFLLVLDDVLPDKLEWEPLHDFLKLCLRGSKVLVTSRYGDVARITGALTTKKLDFLPEQECWKLFAKRAFIDGKCTEELEEIGREIIRKCDFLPLAVKAMAGLLRRYSDVQKWRRIERNGVWEEDNSNTRSILPALKLSYDHLPSELKQCFAYCCIFPKGYMFDKKQLVKLWTAEGYIQPNGEDKFEDIGSDYFDELLTRSFFQLLDIDNRETYKMHDLMHDLAKSVSSCCAQIEEDRSASIAPNTRHVSFLGKDAQQSVKKILTAHKLRTLLLPTTYAKDFGQTLDKIFRTLNYLRVLDLNSSTIKDLPKSIGELKLLRYLDLSRTEIALVPDTICNLHNLQTLRLLQCLWLKELPKDLGNLQSLRHLELDEMFWYKCSSLPPRIGSLTNLHNLHTFHVGQETGYRMAELQLMKNLEGMLHISKLENSEDATLAELRQKECIDKLVLEWSDTDADPQERTAHERVLEDLEPHHSLQELYIKHFKGNRFATWLGSGMHRNLSKISLIGCTNCRILSIGALTHLRELRIKGMLELVEWPEETYPSLTKLSISNCPQLKELPRMFPKLRAAKIKQCHALTSLPVMRSLKFLRLINNASLEDCGADVWETDIRKYAGEKVPIPSLMNLLELKIVDCPRLHKLPQFFFPQKLEISRCTSLRTLLVTEHSQRLQCLQLDKCIGTSLIEAIPSTDSLYSLIISNIINLASLPQLPHLPGLKALHINSCNDLTSLSHANGSLRSLTSLKYLSISGCSKLENFPDGLPSSIEWLSVRDCSLLQSFQSGNCLTSLTSLKDLYLENCPKLGFFPEDGLPAHLQHLFIRGCPLLVQKCSNAERSQCWPIISHIADLEIDYVTTPEPQTSIGPSKCSFACFRA